MNPDEAPPPEDIAAAEAHRRRVFKRTVLGAMLCIAAFIGLRIWWGFEAGRQLQAEIDRYRAAGQPIFPEDFNPPTTIPDESNAAILYKQAWAAVVQQTDTRLSFWDATADSRVCAAYPNDVRKTLEANKQTLELLRQARDMPEADWGIRFVSPFINVMLPMLGPQRSLAKLARTAAVFQHQHGHHAEAIETVLDILTMATRLQRQENGVLVAHLVTLANNIAAIDGLERMMPTLLTCDARFGGQPPDNPATREQLDRLIRMLLEEDAIRSSWRNAFYCERAFLLDYVRQIAQGTTGPRSLLGGGPLGLWNAVATRFTRPMYELDTVRMMQHTTRLSEASLAPSWSEANDLAPPFEFADDGTTIEKAAHFMSSMVLPSFERSFLLHFRTLAMRRMAATALAVRLYELDHGRRPASLDDLVPGYLDALPRDPFAVGNDTFKYKPDAPSSILYSVGPDGRDDGGRFALTKRGEVDPDQKDIPFFLNGDRPMSPLKLRFSEPTSPQAIEDQGEQQGGEGNADQRQEDRAEPQPG